MSSNQSGDVTTLLAEIRSGDESAKGRLFSIVYEELHQIAVRRMARERPSHTLQPTALLNEAISRLLPGDTLANGEHRRWFFGVAIRAMERVLIEHARKRGADKRGGQWQRVPLDFNLGKHHAEPEVDILDLKSALEELEHVNKRQSEVVRLRYFGGLSMKDLAEHLDVSLSTIEKEMSFARAWLYQRLSQGS